MNPKEFTAQFNKQIYNPQQGGSQGVREFISDYGSNLGSFFKEKFYKNPMARAQDWYNQHANDPTNKWGKLEAQTGLGLGILGAGILGGKLITGLGRGLYGAITKRANDAMIADYSPTHVGNDYYESHGLYNQGSFNSGYNASIDSLRPRPTGQTMQLSPEQERIIRRQKEIVNSLYLKGK